MKTVTQLAMLAILLFAAETAIAANHYIRSGAAGTNNGNDWINAYTSLPSALIRGDTYYIAGGNYSSYNFDDPESGSSVITIKKAIASDHGTDTGWQASYGTTQAVFNSELTFTRSNYVFNGQIRNESNWFDGAAYGIQIYHNNQLNQNIVIGSNGSTPANNITINDVYINAPLNNLPGNTIRQYAVDTDTYGGAQHTGLVFSRMYVQGSNNVWFLRSTTGAILEYSASNGVAGNSANHGEIVNLYYSGTNAIIRYNNFKNAYLSGGGTALVAITYANGLQFYGNVASDFQVGDGAVGFIGGDASNCVIYNNTFIRGTAAAGFASNGSNNLVKNNLWVGNRAVGVSGSHDYNGFSDSDARGEAYAQTNIPTSVFANYSSTDLKLATPTNKGSTLPSPYNIDMFGNIRGTDGTWDMGAFEFVGSTSITKVLPPTNVRIQ